MTTIKTISTTMDVDKIKDMDKFLKYLNECANNYCEYERENAIIDEYNQTPNLDIMGFKVGDIVFFNLDLTKDPSPDLFQDPLGALLHSTFNMLKCRTPGLIVSYVNDVVTLHTYINDQFIEYKIPNFSLTLNEKGYSEFSGVGRDHEKFIALKGRLQSKWDEYWRIIKKRDREAKRTHIRK